MYTKSGNRYSFMHEFWKMYLSKLQTKKQMSYNLTLYVYLNVKNGRLLRLHVQKFGNGQHNNLMKVVSLNIRKFKH